MKQEKHLTISCTGMHTSGDDFALIVFWSANGLIAFKCPTWCASVMRLFAENEMKTTIIVLLLPILMATVFAEEPKVQSVTVFTGPWLITLESSGRAHAQYGSLPGDGGYVTNGTVDFASLLKSIMSTPKKDKTEPSDQFQVAIHYEGQTSTTGFSLTDTGFLKRLLGSLDFQWKQDPGGTRFNDLRKQYPIVKEF